jgi:hypothetical protein
VAQCGYVVETRQPPLTCAVSVDTLGIR